MRACRACDATDLVSVLDLGQQPLANQFLREDQLDWTACRYPLHMVRCIACGLCQLTHVVDPNVLYGSGYAYRSGYSEGWREHCRALATELAGKSVLDIGCLDGVLLDECEKQGCEVMGCDPSGTSEHPLVPELFTEDTRVGQFDVIVAQNCFAHVDDARGFLEGVAANLKPHGVAVIECPWIAPLIESRRWDTIYAEHLSYWGLLPMFQLLQRSALCLRQATYFPEIHGGTMRYYLQSGCNAWVAGVVEHMNTEVGLDYAAFRDSVQCEIQYWSDWFRENNQKVIAGYGASAKSSTFLNALPERPPLVGIFDDNPTKWNLYTPGHHYPVLAPTKHVLREVDELICFSPNWFQGIQAKAESLGFTGEIRSIWRA